VSPVRLVQQAVEWPGDHLPKSIFAVHTVTVSLRPVYQLHIGALTSESVPNKMLLDTVRKDNLYVLLTVDRDVFNPLKFTTLKYGLV